jgi:hypothetical protein
VYVADVRTCPFLRAEERILPAAGMAPVKAHAAGVSCDSTCKRKGKKCLEAEQDYVNTCASMRANFPCEVSILVSCIVLQCSSAPLLPPAHSSQL